MSEVEQFEKPVVKYAKSGSINIAYQVFGSGPVDLVYIPGWVSNIDWMWACPELVGFFQELGKIARVILFDKRGTGLSDRVVEFSTLEERMDDIKAVMDTVGSEKAILFGHSEGGSVSALFSATYPNRAISLITFGIFAKRRHSKNYPWAPTDEERQKVYDMIENSWGGGEMRLETLAPSKADDDRFMNWLANYFRSGASPGAAMALTKMNTEVDIIDILGHIKVPSLIIQRKDDIDVKIDEGRFIAKRIKHSKFVELDGEDHLFWVGNTKEILDEIKAFIKETPRNTKYDEELYTVLSGKVMTSENPGKHFDLIAQYIIQYGGEIIRNESKGFTAVFKVPGKAVFCSTKLLKALQEKNMAVSMGIYIKDCSQCVNRKVVNCEPDSVTDSVFAQIGFNQILITQAVRHLLWGVELNFTKHASIMSPDSGTLCQLYRVSAPNEPDAKNVKSGTAVHAQYDSFLEDVFQAIDKHLDDETFGVEKLSKILGMSERQLQRKIKSITHKSPNQLITLRRLHKAKEALMLQRYTVAEIAFKLGFSSPSYFSKCFKKEFGTHPTSIFQGNI